MAQYVYYRGSQGSRETVTYDIVRGSQYITTCVVDVQLLLCGVKAFPCGNGDDVKLTAQQRLEILETVREERKRITDRYPVKTYEGWQESGLPSFEDYCFPGDKVDDDMVQHFVDSVPPVLMLSFCTQAGEPYSSGPEKRGGAGTDCIPCGRAETEYVHRVRGGERGQAQVRFHPQLPQNAQAAGGFRHLPGRQAGGYRQGQKDDEEGRSMTVNRSKLKELDSHWNEVVGLAAQYGFVVQAYGGAVTLLTHKNQLEAVGEEQYIKRQREMNCIDMEAPEPEE